MARPAVLQIVRNLTTNAIQAMPGGGVLRLATRHDPASRTVEAIVSDTGPGLAPEAQKHLFEPFFTTKSEGTGLGLAIAREIALAHRGDLRVANGLYGTGAVFTLVLPAASSAGDGEAP
jgi:signal transduction histidine kinase